MTAHATAARRRSCRLHSSTAACPIAGSANTGKVQMPTSAAAEKSTRSRVAPRSYARTAPISIRVPASIANP